MPTVGKSQLWTRFIGPLAVGLAAIGCSGEIGDVGPSWMGVGQGGAPGQRPPPAGNGGSADPATPGPGAGGASGSGGSTGASGSVGAGSAGGSTGTTGGTGGSGNSGANDGGDGVGFDAGLRPTSGTGGVGGGGNVVDAGNQPDAASRPDAGNSNPPPLVCTSNQRWTGGNSCSPMMHPGGTCITCHLNANGPRHTIAGTVYPTVREPNDCNGSNGAGAMQVVITDAAGRVLTLPVNNVGNFYTTTSVTFPIRAKVVRGAVERAMPVAQSNGNCNSCHTQAGANGAPGRIMAP